MKADQFLFNAVILSFLCFCVQEKTQAGKVFSFNKKGLPHQMISIKNSFSDTLTKKELFEKMKKVITNVLDIKPEKIRMQSRYSKDLGADDLDSVEIVMGFEETFKIKIPDKDAAFMTSVQSSYNYLIRRLRIRN